MASPVRVGTRGSALALVQAEGVAARLRAAHPGVEITIEVIATRGDLDQTTALAEGSQVGWFTSAIQQALLRGECDLAVHSYKDLPTKRPDGLVIAAIPERADPRDAFVSRDRIRLRNLPAGAVIGTSSPRREAQVLAIRPDLVVKPIRGNVDTRIAKVRSGDYDGAVLALAGLERLGRAAEATEIFGFEEMLPAPAQGALAIECRADDTETLALVQAIDDPALRAVVSAERAFLATLEAGCHYPAGAYAEMFGSTLKLHAFVAPNGRVVRSKMGGPAAIAGGLGQSLARELLALT